MSQGKTALHYAVEAESADVVRHLLNAGASLTARDASGRTPAGSPPPPVNYSEVRGRARGEVIWITQSTIHNIAI